MLKNLFDRIAKITPFQKQERLQDWAAVLTARGLTSQEVELMQGWDWPRLRELIAMIDEHTLPSNLPLLQQLVLPKLANSPERLLRAKEFEVVKEMCELVRQLRWSQWMPMVIELLGRQEEALQIVAVETLKVFPTDDTVELLLTKLKNPRKYNVTRIAQVLKGYQVDVGAKLKRIFGESEALVQAVIINLLSELESVHKLELVRNGLQSQDKLVIKRSLEVAAKVLPYEEAVAVYRQMLHAEESQLRIKAYEGIASVMEDKGLAILKQGLLDQDWLVRNYCAGRIDLLVPLAEDVWKLVKTKGLTEEQWRALERFVAQPIVNIKYVN